MPSVGWRVVHLFALSGMGVAQPLLSLLGDNPTFFTAHDAGTADIVGFALLLVVVPPAVCAGIMVVAHRVSARVGEHVHAVFVALFGFLLVLPVVDDLPGPWLVVLVAAALAAAGLGELYKRFAGVRSFVSVLAAAPFAFVAYFLFVAPVNAVAFPDDVRAVTLDDLVDDIGDGSETSDEQQSVAEQISDRFPPVFLLVFDELPWPSLVDENGDVDAERYPNFARLAATSHVFTDATAPGFQTEQSIPIILTGRREVADAPVYSLYPDNLFTLLGGVYDVSSSDPLVDLCPPSVCNGETPAALLELLASEPDATTPTLPASGADEGDSDGGSPFDLLLEDAAIVYGHLVTPDDLDIGLPSIGSSWGSFGRGVGTADPNVSTAESSTSTTTTIAVETGVAPETGTTPPVDTATVSEARTRFLESLITDDNRVAEMRAEIAAIDDRGHPQLDYLHVLLPHVPWRHHGDGSTYADVALPGYFELWNDDDGVATLGQQRHLLQLQFTDQLLGEYLDRLELVGLFDRAAVIVTADHGISFIAGERSRGFFHSNAAGIAAVPLFWKEPAQTANVRHDEPVGPIDIVPTLARRLAVDIPWDVDGVDLFGDLAATRERFVAGFGGFGDLPPDYPDLVDDVIATYHERFGTGAAWRVYAAAGHAELIGEPVDELVDAATDACWVPDGEQSILEAGGRIGYVLGSVRTSDPARIDYAIVVDGVVAGTSHTYGPDGTHEVYGIGHPDAWRRSADPAVEIHEIVDGRLRPISRC